jgi:hypothetical protein
MAYDAKFFKDGTVRWWSVYKQVWHRGLPSGVPDRELAAMDADTRERIIALQEEEKGEYKKQKVKEWLKNAIIEISKVSVRMNRDQYNDAREEWEKVLASAGFRVHFCGNDEPLIY